MENLAKLALKISLFLSVFILLSIHSYIAESITLEANKSGNIETTTTLQNTSSTKTVKKTDSTAKTAEVSESNLKLPIFPGAEGFGTTTVAGSGRHLTPWNTTIYKVTNLNDSGEGSLRDAVSKPEPRTIVFEVGGIIELEKLIPIKSPYITIAGQTAPPPGITLKNYGIMIEDTHDVLIQHLAVRIGDKSINSSIDCISNNSANLPTYNIVLDHLSVSWWQDGGIDFYKRPNTPQAELRDITVSNCIISEGLNLAGHALATMVGDGSKNISFIRNLWAHNVNRNPLITGNTSVLLVNNLVYNPQYYGAVLTNTGDYGTHTINIQGAVVIQGPDTKDAWDGLTILPNVNTSSTIFANDLLSPNMAQKWPGVRNYTSSEQLKAPAAPITVQPLTVMPSSQVVNFVLSNAGRIPWSRDKVDERVVNDVKNKSGKIINSQNDVGGWPSLLPTQKKLKIPANPNNKDESGYTNLEKWLHSYLVQ